MRANPDRQRHLLHARDGGRRVPAAPSRGTLKTRKETMSAIWRSLVLKPKSATLSGQRTTTSMPNIISDRCAQTQKVRRGVRDLAVMAPRGQGPAGDPARSLPVSFEPAARSSRSASLWVARNPNRNGLGYEEGRPRGTRTRYHGL
jgi:hypothetical protein